MPRPGTWDTWMRASMPSRWRRRCANWWRPWWPGGTTSHSGRRWSSATNWSSTFPTGSWETATSWMSKGTYRRCPGEASIIKYQLSVLVIVIVMLLGLRQFWNGWRLQWILQRLIDCWLVVEHVDMISVIIMSWLCDYHFRDLDLASMEAVASLLQGLPLQPEESDRGDLMEAKSQLFLKYFFISLCMHWFKQSFIFLSIHPSIHPSINQSIQVLHSLHEPSERLFRGCHWGEVRQRVEGGKDRGLEPQRPQELHGSGNVQSAQR